MPEEQNVQGERWHKLLNQFLKQVMGWEQLGDRNNDIYCEETKGIVGIDSVFTYKRNPHCPQQIIFVEAKTRKNMKALSSREMQKWINRIIYSLRVKINVFSCYFSHISSYIPKSVEEIS